MGLCPQSWHRVWVSLPKNPEYRQKMDKTLDQPTPLTPLFVDLDETLTPTDTLWEAVFALIKKQPLMLVFIPFWLAKGKAEFKTEVTKRLTLAPEDIPLRPEIMDFITAEKEKGRAVYLATASDEHQARPLFEHLGIFDGLICSKNGENLKSEKKRDAIKAMAQENHGSEAYGYIGDTTADRPIWATAEEV